MNPRLKQLLGPFLRAARIVAGILFVLVGIAGLFLPILQGILFIFIGLALLGVDKDRLRRAWFFTKERARRLQAKLTRHDH
jgi:uncharacterized membrane protein YbaN (DUF454 family)